MLIFPRGRFPVRVETGEPPFCDLIYAAVVDGEIHARSMHGEWVFTDGGEPLSVEDEPFALHLGGHTAFWPATLVVRIQGEDGLSSWVSNDDGKTWERAERYWPNTFRQFGQAPELGYAREWQVLPLQNNE